MTAYEKAKKTVIENETSADEMYHGIAFLYYCDIITNTEYKDLMRIFNENHPDY